MTESEVTQHRTIRIEGDLSMHRVPGRLRESRRWFEPGTSLTMDLGAVGHTDSAGVALLVDWVRRARSRKCQLTFINIPTQMHAILAFCRLEHELPEIG